MVGYGFDGKSPAEQKRQTDEAEERGSTMLGPTGSNKRRRDEVIAILDKFIRGGIRTYNAVFHGEPKPVPFRFEHGTLGRRIEVANQMWRDLQMGGETPSDLDLNKLEHSYYKDDKDDGDY